MSLNEIRSGLLRQTASASSSDARGQCSCAAATSHPRTMPEAERSCLTGPAAGNATSKIPHPLGSPYFCSSQWEGPPYPFHCLDLGSKFSFLALSACSLTLIASMAQGIWCLPALVGAAERTLFPFLAFPPWGCVVMYLTRIKIGTKWDSNRYNTILRGVSNYRWPFSLSR